MIRDLVKEISYVKTRKILGLLESNEVTIRGNDIFVGGNTVGSFVTKDDKIEFTASSDGTIHTFENDEELMDYVSGLTEDVKAPEGYDKHELAPHHKDARMENPKKTDHGNDDPSKDKEPKGSGGGSNPPDKQTELKSKHKDDRMENPKKNDHGHDDSSSDKEPTGKSASAPKAHDHTPNGKGHGHDDSSGIGKVKGK